MQLQTLRLMLGVVISAACMIAVAAAQQGAATSGVSAPSALGDGPWDFDAADYRIRVSKVAGNLEFPYGMAWLPDGTMLLTERAGRLRMVRNGALDPTPIEGIPKVLFKDYDGLLDVTAHPQYAANHLIYFTYSKPREDDPAAGQCVLARARYDGGHQLLEVKDLFVNDRPSPHTVTQTALARLAWGPDGMLYMTCSAPDMDRFQAQDPSSHGGKVLRLKDDGTAPPDNPLIGKTEYALPFRAEIFTTGHGAGAAIAIHPQTAQVWEVEAGPRGGDELNILKPGRNYGWPLISLGRGENGSRMKPAISDMEHLEQPVMFWSPSIEPSGLMFYTGDKFPRWKGNMFISALTGRRIERLALNTDFRLRAASTGNSEFLLGELKQRIRQMQQGPDGLLYVITDYPNGALLRIEPTAERAVQGRPGQ